MASLDCGAAIGAAAIPLGRPKGGAMSSMLMRIGSGLSVLALAAASCGGSESVPDETVNPPVATTSQEFATSVTPTTGPPITNPPTNVTGLNGERTLMKDGFVFRVDPIGSDCARLTITAPEGDQFVNERCFHIDTSVDNSPTCLNRPDDSAGGESGSAGDRVITCDLTAPSVLYGRVAPAIGHVCVAEWAEAGFGYVRFLEFDDNRLILVEDAVTDPGSRGLGASHHFSEGGSRVGSEPLDAPSGPIYDMCAALAPWDAGNHGPSDEFRYDAEVDVLADAPEELRDLRIRLELTPNDWIVYLNGGVHESSVQFIPIPAEPTLSVGGVSVDLSLESPPNLTSSWKLILLIGSGAVSDTDGIVIDPTAISLLWEEN